MEIQRRFMDKTMPVTESGCWIWMGKLRSNSVGLNHRYGFTSISGKEERAHRLSYKIFRGEIPDGLYVLHKCDVTQCVNPDHLFLGTQKENLLDASSKGRTWRKVTEQQVAEMRMLHASNGDSYAKLSRKFSLSPDTVVKIIKRKTWAHIP